MSGLRFSVLEKFFVARRRLTSVGLYGAINALPRITAAILAICYASVFSLSAYGSFGILSVSIGLLGIVLDLGIPQAILRNYYDLHHDWMLAREYLASVIFSARIVSLAMLPVLGLAMYGTWPLLHIVHAHIPEYILLILAISFFERTSSILSSILRALEKPFHYSLGQLLQAIATLSTGVILVLFLHAGVKGALLALFAGRFVAATTYQLLLYFNIGVRGGRLDWTIIKACLGFGLPLVPNRLAVWAREAALRPILVSVVTLASVGLFSLASSVAALPMLVSTAVDFVLSPHYFKQRVVETEGFTQRVFAFGSIFLATLLPIWAALVLFSPELIRIFAGNRYRGAAPICAALLCGSFIRSQQPFLARQVHFLRETWILPAVTIPAAIVSIALAVLFALKFGIAASGWGVAIAEFGLYIALAACIRAYEPLHHPFAITLGMGTGLMLLAFWVNSNQARPDGLPEIVVKSLILAAIAAICTAVWIWPNRAFIRSIARG